MACAAKRRDRKDAEVAEFLFIILRDLCVFAVFAFRGGNPNESRQASFTPTCPADPTFVSDCVTRAGP